MLNGLVILLGFQFAGELCSRLLELPIPGNVIGMAMLLAALSMGLVKEESFRDAGELLLKYMSLFFVPAGVAVMLYFDLIAKDWLPILVGMVVSTFVVMAVAGWIEQLTGGKGD